MKWLNDPEDHDYAAAEHYLTLIADVGTARATVLSMKRGRVQQRAAKDILRASRLQLLDETNAHVAADLAKIKDGKKLSPILLVRGSVLRGIRLQIADGYHRVCAAYHLDENTEIPCQIGDWCR